jgi:hypothetical protein
MALAVAGAIGLLLLGIGAAVCLGVLVAGCGGPDATRRIEAYFDLSDTSTPEAIEAEIARRFPAGTSIDAVPVWLSTRNIGADRHASVTDDPSESRLIVTIDLDPASFGVVKEVYDVLFTYDAQRRIEDVEVRRHLTGL